MQRVLNLDAFLKDVDRQSAAAVAMANRVIQRVVFDVAENVIVGGAYAQGTPVDTGFARASWQILINVAPDAIPETPPNHTVDSKGNIDWQGPLNRNLANVASEGVGVGDVIYLVNNVDYITALEYGHSKQAPNGMVRQTLYSQRQIVQAAIAKEKAA